MLPYLEPEKLFFSTFDEATLKEISVKRITNPTSLDRLGNPFTGGLYDPALGPSERDEVCATCKQYAVACPGHFGYIQLPLPVFNPIYFSYLVAVLRSTCFCCSKLLCRDYEGHVLALQLKAIRIGQVACAESLSELAQSILSRNKNKNIERGEDEPEAQSDLDIVQEIISSTTEMLNSTLLSAKKGNTASTDESLFILLTAQLKTMAIRKDCPHCKAPVRDVTPETNVKIYLKPLPAKRIDAWTSAVEKCQKTCEDTDTIYPWQRVNKNVLLTPNSALSLLKEVWSTDKTIWNLLFNGTPPTTFFFSCICVPPTKFRPISVMNGRKYDNVLSEKLSGVISGSIQLSLLLSEHKNETSADKDSTLNIEEQNADKYKHIQTMWLKIQSEVNAFMGMIKQTLEKKQGLFRMHMMGKRVNYAARSVISPDPYINCNEVGIPLVFATKLTFSQPVTPWNVEELRRAVMNGPDIHPGATHVEMEDGRRVMLKAGDPAKREAIAKALLVEDKDYPGYNKKVCRHVVNGDCLLLNRQPTLHRPSILAHKARVLPNEKTLRLHYSVCKSYNADFDGDEMNAHMPQDELSRAEAYCLMDASDQYLVPKDGKPLGGLIQDHIVSGVLLTQRGRFFDKDEYTALVYKGLIDTTRRIALLPPAILKPRKLWSGKQIITTILKALVPPKVKLLTLFGKCKTPEKCWLTSLKKSTVVGSKELLDSEMIILEGEMLSGVMDKGQCGSSSYGIVHCVFELYGGEVTNLFLSALGRLFTAFLQYRGFTLGIEDIVVIDEGEGMRNVILEGQYMRGEELACKALGVDLPQDLKKAYQLVHLKPSQFRNLATLDRAAKPETNRLSDETSRACMGLNLLKLFPDNNLQLMVNSGAKGSGVNCLQISCLLGQIELEGQRPPLMISGRSLPSYLPYEPSLAAGGFVASRFLTGIRPQEYFFHCMAGREGLVDTAVKTSRSGYIQRCLIKHLEGLCISYDMTVRDSDGSIVQFLYGNDGIDVTKSQYLTPGGLQHMRLNYDIVSGANKSELDRLDTVTAPRAIKLQQETVTSTNRYITPFTMYSSKMRKKKKYKVMDNEKKHETNNRSEQDKAIFSSWYKLSKEKRNRWQEKCGTTAPLPLLSSLPPHLYYGSLSDKLQGDLNVACKGMPDKEKSLMRETMTLRAMKALTHPGDGVGVIAGQSLGEPSTQMTLNTFHFAGRSDMNITMGIPRLREILMTSGTNIKTPLMTIPLRVGVREGQAKKLARILTQVTLGQVLQRVDVYERMTMVEGDIRRRYRIRFSLLPTQTYSDRLHCTAERALRYIERHFVNEILKEVMRLVKNKMPRAELNTGAEKEVEKEKEGDEEGAPDNKESEETNEEKEEVSGKRLEQAALIDEEEEEEETVVEQYEEEVKEELVSEEEEEENKGEKEEDSTKESAAVSSEATIRELDFRKRYRGAVSYKFDEVKSEWCELELDLKISKVNVMMCSVIEMLANRCLVWKTQDIKRALVNNKQDKRGRFVISTEGINIREMWKYDDIVDTAEIYTNNINKLYECYGIEAAMNGLVQEISTVFGAYGIDVNARHLTLIAEYMTQHGSYRAFNRTGIKANTSPLQKMTFETCMEFLRRAAFYNESDILDSPSSCIVTGKIGKYGTGICEIRQPLTI